MKRVISPDKIELSNGLIVRLLGIQPKQQHRVQAISFLQEKFQKRKVFLKYDTVKYDAENNLLFLKGALPGAKNSLLEIKS